MAIVKDTGDVFVINPLKRTVEVPQNHRVIGTAGENLSEQITFRSPQIIDGRDISTCDLHYIAWVSANGINGHDDLKVARAIDGYVDLIWTIRQGLTAAVGLVQFAIHFEDKPSSNGDTPYHWGTSTCKDCRILESINTQLGVYKSIYVDGNTLVIADYTPVQDRVLELNSNTDLTHLKPENIRRGVSINGVPGTLECIYAELDPKHVRKGLRYHGGEVGTYGGGVNVPFYCEKASTGKIKLIGCTYNLDTGLLEEIKSAEYSSSGLKLFGNTAQDGLFVVMSENPISYELVDGSHTTRVAGGIDLVAYTTNAIVFQVHGNDKDIRIIDRKG